MVHNDNYLFKVSLSNESYINKEISGAMIGSTKDENNRKIRKQYGYKANKGIGYIETEVTAQSLLEHLINGCVFCHLFTPQQIRKDGTFGSSQKKDDNFKGSFCIGVDIDETSYSSINDYIDKLQLKPTFWYSSYSNKKDKPKFRMVYVFDELIENKYFFRYCAWQLNMQIENDVDEEITDDCNLRCSQYFNGTNINNKDLIVEYGITNNIYSLYDFNITEYGFIQFCKSDCYYKTKNKERTIELNNIIYSYYNNYSSSSIDSSISTTYYIESEKWDSTSYTEYDDINEVTSTGSIKSKWEYDTTLVNDMARLPYDEFMKYNRHKYHYFYRVEKPQWIDNTYQYIDEDYFALYFNVKTVQDGCKRRKKVFERMCLRRVINHNATIDDIIFNAYEDIYRYFDNSDNKLNIDYIVKNAIRCFSLSIEDIKEMYSNNIEYLKSKKPKSGIILKSNLGTVADRNKILKEIRYSLIDDFFDSNLSINENIEIINNNLFPIGKDCLYAYCKDRNINTKKYTDEDILSLYDSNLSIRKNIEVMKSYGINISKSKLQRMIKDINNSNNNISNNINISSNISFNISSITTNYNETEKWDTKENEENLIINQDFLKDRYIYNCNLTNNSNLMHSV